MTEEQRDELARILEMIATDGLPHPRHLDAALDAIEDIFPRRVLVPGPDHSLRWADLQRQKVCVSEYSRGFVYEYTSDAELEPGFRVSEEWVAQ